MARTLILFIHKLPNLAETALTLSLARKRGEGTQLQGRAKLSQAIPGRCAKRSLSPRAGEGRDEGLSHELDQRLLAPTCATASISTFSDGSANAATCTSVEAGKLPVKTSRRAC